VPLLQISELAATSGVPTSTLRYYERIGLVRPTSRTPAGYRLYDEDSVERLAFIGRAKRLGMALDDVATLIEAWFAGECGPLQDRLRGFVDGRIVELRRHIADESAFEHQLRRILARLDRRDVVPERCEPDCGCDLDPGAPSSDDGPGERGDTGSVLACTLSEHELRRRRGDWDRLLSRAVHVEPSGRRWRFVFDPTGPAVTELATMCADETTCCPFFEFTLDISARAVVLTVDGPDDLIDVFAPGPVAPDQTLAR
jgi:DNA-binding transcriptional MerR regulator